jgi:hypothetical protein
MLKLKRKEVRKAESSLPFTSGSRHKGKENLRFGEIWISELFIN